jgi:hypothetical protein
MAKKIDANVRCPSCNGQLFPRVLVCDACGLKVEGEFVTNEFGSLTPDELHFLRVFVTSEGSIRDMEAALGVSYPTVKARLSALKRRLGLGGQGEPEQAASAPEGLSTEEVLDGLEGGRIPYEDAVRMLRARKKGKSRDKD